MQKMWVEIGLTTNLALITVLLGGVGLLATGVLDEYVVAETPQDAPSFGCGVEATYVLSGPVPIRQAQLPAEQVAALLAGEALFQGNCAQCHAVNEIVVGPARAGVRKRRPEKWLISWVKNSSKMVSSGDEYSVKIFDQY